MRFDERFLDEIKSRLRLSDVIGRDGEAAPAGARVRRPVALHQGEDARRSTSTTTRASSSTSPRGKTRRPDQLPAGDRAADLRRGGGAAGGRGGRGAAGASIRARAEEEKKRQGLCRTGWSRPPSGSRPSCAGRPAREARAYLEKRGLPEKEWARFRLGYSPAGRTALKDYLVAKGAQARRAGRDRPADRAGGRRRALRPLPRPDHLPDRRRARAGGLVRRPGDGSAGPRQVPERPGDRALPQGPPRSTAWPRRARSSPHAREADETRRWWWSRATWTSSPASGPASPAVAPMGTALGEEQMEMLWRHHPEPTLCFDGDRAGRRAAARAMDRALPLLKPGKQLPVRHRRGRQGPRRGAARAGAGGAEGPARQDHALRRGPVHPRARRWSRWTRPSAAPR